ncbi:protein-transmembrane prediction [Haloferula chungangensis]
MSHFRIILAIALLSQFPALAGNLNVSTLEELNAAIAKSGNTIRMEPGRYDLEQLPRNSRKLAFSGSDNTVILKDVYVKVTVGLVNRSYIEVTGDNNTITGGEFEDTYKSGITFVKDFSAYNKDRRNLAAGLRGDAVMNVDGRNNTVKDLKLTVRGSWPYGYGSFYGIGAPSTFGLNKRCGILVRGVGNTLDGIELQQRAFGHGIYMQKGADKTVIRNCHVEGRIRKTGDLYQETDREDLPKRSGYRFPNRDDFKLKSPGSYPIPKDRVHSLCEDGIRMYNIRGSITVENCTVTKMRGGIRLYLGGPAIVKDCTVTYCEYTGYNLPNKGRVINSSGDFSFGPLTDYRSNRSGTRAEWTILPSPEASGAHNIMDILGNGHRITLNREKGPIDLNQERAIVIHGNDSTIINRTEYKVVLAKGTKGNRVSSYGPVSGEMGRNKVEKLDSLQP